MAACVDALSRVRSRASRIGALLGRNRAASACMDLSDGLADAVAADGGGAAAPARAIDAAALPIPAAARAVVRARRRAIRSRGRVAGGDDYELLFAVPRRARGRLRDGRPPGARRADHAHRRADEGAAAVAAPRRRRRNRCPPGSSTSEPMQPSPRIRAAGSTSCSTRTTRRSGRPRPTRSASSSASRRCSACTRCSAWSARSRST